MIILSLQNHSHFQGTKKWLLSGQVKRFCYGAFKSETQNISLNHVNKNMFYFVP